MKRLWIVRAGSNGERELEAIKTSRLLPGFADVGDLTGKDRAGIAATLRKALASDTENRIKNFAAQLNQFVNTIQAGDLVVLPRKLTSGVAVGEVAGPYVYDPKQAGPHTRAVKWSNDAVPRESFGQDLRHSLGAFMTICEVKRNEALARIEAISKTGVDPGPLLGKQGKATAPAADDIEADEADYDIEYLANEQIVSLIKAQFAGHALANLISQILEVEGYTTRVSPPGADGGVDILAAGGKLGLGEDSLCIQVKSGDGAANHDVVLKLLGAVQATNARTGLLVSLGGVNRPAQDLLDQHFFRLRLWQMSDVLRVLFRAYPRLSDETRARLPLRQVWAPVAVAEE